MFYPSGREHTGRRAAYVRVKRVSKAAEHRGSAHTFSTFSATFFLGLCPALCHTCCDNPLGRAAFPSSHFHYLEIARKYICSPNVSMLLHSFGLPYLTALTEATKWHRLRPHQMNAFCLVCLCFFPFLVTEQGVGMYFFR